MNKVNGVIGTMFIITLIYLLFISVKIAMSECDGKCGSNDKTTQSTTVKDSEKGNLTAQKKHRGTNPNARIVPLILGSRSHRHPSHF